MATKKESIGDEMVLSINIKWLVQLVFFVVSITAGYFTLKSNINNNAKDIAIIKESLLEYEDMVDVRVGKLEEVREQQLEEVNRTLLGKIFTKDE